MPGLVPFSVMAGLVPVSVMAGHSPSKTGVNALMPGHPRLDSSSQEKTWMPATSAGMTESCGHDEVSAGMTESGRP